MNVFLAEIHGFYILENHDSCKPQFGSKVDTRVRSVRNQRFHREGSLDHSPWSYRMNSDITASEKWIR